MKGIKFLSFVAGISIILSLSDCKEANEYIPIDVEGQYITDSTIIATYITDHGYSASDLDSMLYISAIDPDTIRRIRSIYTVLDQGDGESLEYNDIVSFNYLMRFSNDSIFYTNSKAVALANELLDSARTYTPVKFTYSSSSWTVPSLLTQELPGYKAALPKLLEGMKTGGHGLIIIPSAQAFGSITTGYIIQQNKALEDAGKDVITIPANSVIIVEIFPVFIRKPNS